MISKNKTYKVFLSTGGSGGHIFPAITIAKELTEHKYDIFIIADEIYKKYSLSNLNYRIIKAGKTLKSFDDIKNIILGFFQSRKLILQERPDLVIGFGSYATLPMLLACIFTKTPFILHEQNMYVGKINKFFAKYSQQLLISYDILYGLNFNDMNKVLYTGSPIREEIKKLYHTKYSYPKEDEKFIVLITGGSAGAQIFSEYLPKIFDKYHKKEQERIKVYHQVRPEYVKTVREYYKFIDLDAEVDCFFNNIDELLKKSHLVIGRAGSGTIFEVSVAGKPSILIPLSSRNNNRQIDNVKFLIENNAAKIVLENDFNINSFQEMFFDIIKNEKLLKNYSKNIKKLVKIDANEIIFKIIEDFCKKNEKK